MAPAPASAQAQQQVVDRLWEIVPPLWHRMRANVRGIASERYQVSVPQFRILRHIGRGVRSARELASLTQTSPPAVSQCVEALAEKGLVTRRQSAHDRRCVELELTPSGRELLDAVFAESRHWLEQQLAALSPAEMEHVLHGMAALKKAFTL